MRGIRQLSHLHLNVTYLAVADPAEHVRIKADENSGVKWVGLDEAVALSSEPWIRERIYRKLIEKTRAGATLRNAVSRRYPVQAAARPLSKSALHHEDARAGAALRHQIKNRR